MFTYVSVVAENIESSDLSRSSLQIRQNLKSFGSVSDLGESLEGSSEDENPDESSKLHDERGCS